jgi:hypothetical protein
MVLSIGIFFTLMIIGLSADLPSSLHAGLVAHDVPNAAASSISKLPPVSSLFAAFLGYNPMQTLLSSGGVLAHLQAVHPAQAHVLLGRSFFPQLLSHPFSHALDEAFTFALIACAVAAVASLLRGGKYHWAATDEETVIEPGDDLGIEPVALEAAAAETGTLSANRQGRARPRGVDTSHRTTRRRERHGR